MEGGGFALGLVSTGDPLSKTRFLILHFYGSESDESRAIPGGEGQAETSRGRWSLSDLRCLACLPASHFGMNEDGGRSMKSGFHLLNFLLGVE